MTELTNAEAINKSLADLLSDDKVLVIGQQVKYGNSGITSSLFNKFPKQVITYPVSESLMNSSALGLSLAGYKPIVIHERMDFLACGMDSLVNHIPWWSKKITKPLPIVIMAIVGKGNGQGPQHSKNLAPWFRSIDGWTVFEPDAPGKSAYQLIQAVKLGTPAMFVVHREILHETNWKNINSTTSIRFCGASRQHESKFYQT